MSEDADHKLEKETWNKAQGKEVILMHPKGNHNLGK